MWILGGTLPPVRLSVSRVSVDPVRLPRSRPPLNNLGGGEWWVGRERMVGIMVELNRGFAVTREGRSMSFNEDKASFERSLTRFGDHSRGRPSLSG